jgi:hypothetical protein
MSVEIYKLKYLKYKAKYLKLLGGMGNPVPVLARTVTSGPITDPNSLIGSNLESIVKCLNVMISRSKDPTLQKLAVYYKSNNRGEYYLNLHASDKDINDTTKVSHFSFHHIPTTEAQDLVRNKNISSWHYKIDAGSHKDQVFNLYFDENDKSSNIVVTFGDISGLPSAHQAILNAFITCSYDLINGNL